MPKFARNARSTPIIPRQNRQQEIAPAQWSRFCIPELISPVPLGAVLYIVIVAITVWMLQKDLKQTQI